MPNLNLVSRSAIVRLVTALGRILTIPLVLGVKYSQEEIDNIKAQDVDKYEYLKYCGKNAFYLNPIPTEKMSAGQTRIGLITIKDVSNINFFELNLEIIQDDYQYFAIEGTDQMIVVKSKDHILKELRKQ